MLKDFIFDTLEGHMSTCEAVLKKTGGFACYFEWLKRVKLHGRFRPDRYEYILVMS